MTRFVIGPDVAIRLARDRTTVPDRHRLVAPTLLRSQVLSLLYAAVRSGDLEAGTAQEQLDFVRGLRIRLLGDRVLQKSAWAIADRFGWPDTYTAEYVALTRLQADALVTLDPQLARAAAEVVTVAAFEALLDPSD